MKIKSGYIARPVAGSYVVVTTGDKTVDFNSIITLNETGYFLWDQLMGGATREELLSVMLSEYEVDEQIAAADIDRFLARLEEADLVE